MKRVEHGMDIGSFSGAATVAALLTLVFALIARSWRLISRLLSPAPAFGASRAREAAQRFNDELELLGASQAIYLSSGLVFLLLFAAAHAFQAGRIFVLHPQWQLLFLVAVLAAGVVLVAAKFVRTLLQRQRVKLLRDANVAVGQRLRRAVPNGGQVFHDVETAAGIIDHVLVAENGVYAISVFARRPSPEGRAELADNVLRFEPSGESESIVSVGKRVAALEREFRRLLDHRVRVRSVIAVPGWIVDSQPDGEHVVVNEHNLALRQGWLDESVEPLPDDDVAAIQELLAAPTTA